MIVLRHRVIDDLEWLHTSVDSDTEFRKHSFLDAMSHLGLSWSFPTTLQSVVQYPLLLSHASDKLQSSEEWVCRHCVPHGASQRIIFILPACLQSNWLVDNDDCNNAVMTSDQTSALGLLHITKGYKIIYVMIKIL